MTNEQEAMWKVLTNDAEFLCHQWAKELITLKGKKFIQLADQYLGFITNNFDDEQALRIVKTWLTSYQLPLEPTKLTSFDAFHIKYGNYIQNHIKSIKVYV